MQNRELHMRLRRAPVCPMRGVLHGLTSPDLHRLAAPSRSRVPYRGAVLQGRRYVRTHAPQTMHHLTGPTEHRSGWDTFRVRSPMVESGGERHCDCHQNSERQDHNHGEVSAAAMRHRGSRPCWCCVAVWRPLEGCGRPLGPIGFGRVDRCAGSVDWLDDGRLRRQVSVGQPIAVARQLDHLMKGLSLLPPERIGAYRRRRGCRCRRGGRARAEPGSALFIHGQRWHQPKPPTARPFCGAIGTPCRDRLGRRKDRDQCFPWP